MPPIGFERLLRRRPIADVLAALTDESYEFDANSLRIGLASPAHETHDVEVDGHAIATVVGHDAARVADVLSAVAEIETARRRLADEVLALYREVNLMYALADRLAGAIDAAELAQRLISEATRLVPARGALVIIEGARPRATEFGDCRSVAEPSELNRARIDADANRSTLVAPLTLDDTERGAIVLSRVDEPFTAGDLKLVTTVASQGAALVARVLDGERRQAAAERRERRLREQIEELRGELDESRQFEASSGHVPELRARIEALRKIVHSTLEPPNE